MPLNFPSSPTNGQTYTDDNSVVWQFDGVAWNVVTGTTKRLFDGVKVGFSTDYALNATLTAVTWDVESFDTDQYWSSGDPTKIHILRTGYYNINTNLFSTAAGQAYDIRVRENGTTDIVSGTINPSQAADYNETQFFDAGDYIQVLASEDTAAGSLTSGSYLEVNLLGYATGTGVTPYAAFSGVRTNLTSAFATTATPTAIAWSGVDWDTNANALAETYWSSGTAGRLTVKVNGYYLINVQVFSGAAGGTYTVTLRKNGATAITSATIAANDSASINQTFELAANDYLEILVSDNLASGSITTNSFFEIIRQGYPS